MIQGENQLTEEMKQCLSQGTKVEFKWHGSDMLYTGRVQVSKYGDLYFVSEHLFDGDNIKDGYECFRYYNRLDSFFFFTYFKILEQHG